MKNFVITLVCFVCLPLFCAAQGENNIWTFNTGSVGSQQDIIDFNGSNPVVITLPFEHGSLCTPVCYPNGAFRFFVNFLGLNLGENNSPKIFKANGDPVPGSVLNLGGTASEKYFPEVIPHPGNPDQYYLFYANTNALLYSLIDMSMNNGAGGIVPGQKDIFLTAFGSICPDVMTAVKGCDGVWLVVRSRLGNQYFSYHVTQAGLDTAKVVSDVGNFPVNSVCGYRLGCFRASPNGRYVAFMSRFSGVELYDFEKCSGRLSNARLIDTILNNSCPPIAGQAYSWLQSICFSPDESKLYETRNYIMEIPHPQQIVQPWGPPPGQLYQFDLSQPNLTQVIASKTLILNSLPSIQEDLFGCVNLYNNTLGDLKVAPDGTIYFDDGSYTPACYPFMPSPPPPGQNLGAFHRINLPNLAGTACQVSLYEIVPPGTGYSGHDFGVVGSYLPPEIVTAPPPPDTTNGQVYYAHACFSDSMTLAADSSGSCYLWDDSSTQRQRNIYQSGRYYVRYYRDCHITTDTFNATLIQLPALIAANQGCPGMHSGKLVAVVNPADTNVLGYTWKASDGSILRYVTRTGGDTLTGLEPGGYSLQISNASGCDTTLYAMITALPQPEIVASPADTTIHYGDSLTLHASGAMLYVWLPSGPLDTATKANPIAKPLQPVLFSVIGLNEYGCEDTGYVQVNIDFRMPDFVPNAFSPNGDGKNDVFKPILVGISKLNLFSIYNRWGQLVFTTSQNGKGWDGTLHGIQQDTGSFVYMVSGVDYQGKTITKKGTFTLVR